MSLSIAPAGKMACPALRCGTSYSDAGMRIKWTNYPAFPCIQRRKYSLATLFTMEVERVLQQKTRQSQSRNYFMYVANCVAANLNIWWYERSINIRIYCMIKSTYCICWLHDWCLNLLFFARWWERCIEGTKPPFAQVAILHTSPFC